MKHPACYGWFARILVGVLCCALGGCRSIEKLGSPSNVRHWQEDQLQLCSADVNGDQVTIHNVRNCHYLSDDVYIPDQYDKAVNLNDIKTVDFIVCPFNDMPAIAHTMLSFGFEKPDGTKEQLAVSVEIRKEMGESYAAWKGTARQYELMYVIADERDVINVRINHRGEQVYMYRSNAEPETVRALFVDILNRTNKLAREPEFYDTLSNNCTTNIVNHINKLRPGKVRRDIRVLLPGRADELAYELDLIEKHGTFEETKRLAHVNPRIQSVALDQNYSQAIRR